MTRQLFSADPQVGPAGLALDLVFANVQLPAGRQPLFPAGPARGFKSVQLRILAVSLPNASLVPVLRPPRANHSV